MKFVQKSQEYFLEKVKEKNKNDIDLSNFIYKGTKTRGACKCNICGNVWETTPNSLYKGCGCPICGKKISSEKQKWTKDKFIDRATNVHGEEYDYSKVVYSGALTNVEIICNKCGESFKQTPAHHINGEGCPFCGGTKNHTQEEFLEMCRNVHGDKYTYDKAVYKSMFDNVIITCKKHGDFKMLPSNHIHKKQGCPICKESKLENEMDKILSNLDVKYERQKKFKWLGRQSLDFYLTDHNIGIECQGRQHFGEVPDFKGAETYEVIKKRDLKKKELCDKNGVELFYYNYNDKTRKEKIIKLIYDRKYKSN